MRQLWRRDSFFGPGPRCPLDREQKARVLYIARLHRSAGRLTACALDVLEALLSFVGPDGRCDPSVASLASRARVRAESTVHLALSRLEELELLRRFRRLVRSGWRTEQTSNAYILMAPAFPVPVPLQASKYKPLPGSSPEIGAAAISDPLPRELPGFLARFAAQREAERARWRGLPGRGEAGAVLR